MTVSTIRATKFAFQDFWRNIWLSVITITMLTLTLITINILLILNIVAASAIAEVENKIDVSVYFAPKTSREIIDAARGYLLGLPQVVDVSLISADDALVRFKDRHANDSKILSSLEQVEGNPFGDSIVVKARSTKDFPFILESLNNPQFQNYIEEKDFVDYEDIIRRINNFTDTAKLFGLIVSGVFLIIAILIVFNTVRVAIFIHREEIGIMRLVGASSAFIRAPFFIEAVLYSLFATLVAVAIIYPILGVLEPKIGLFFGSNNVGLLEYFNNNFIVIFTSEFAGLALLNMISSAFAMRRYLKT